MIQYVLIAGFAAIVTYVLCLAVLRAAHKWKLYPEIRTRDVHTRPTPRLGGIAMFLGVVAAFVVASFNPYYRLIFANPGPVWAILGAAFMIVVIGMADDIWDLDWMIKLAAQFLAAGLIAWLGVQIYSLPIGGLTVGSGWMSVAMTVFAIVLVMNAVNFIDGLDGLVAGVSLIANGVFFLYGYLLIQRISPSDYFSLSLLISAVLCGVCAGFLPLNWHPAKLFMGDAGALLVGLLMATSAIAITGQMDPAFIEGPSAFGRTQLIGAFIPIILPFAILVVPLLDFGLAVTRRLRAGKSPFSADRLHLHHRLLDMGHSQIQAVLIFYAWTIVISVSSLMFFVFQPYTIALSFLIVGVVICTVVTLAPLGRRKTVETAAQSTPEGAVEHAGIAAFDPLDEAANDRSPDAPVPAAVVEFAENLDADRHDGQPKEDIR
ncbi:UDP-GlcNAc:undecaprenyl-phosphate GlcNAc-1-phosphate transferase [Labedella gwakjiensis]|uniref:UDP-GlcNAc:undecaprenyl-phosphate GlcNAc-1-phosphate transferase n=1 Tax=Labedella gwakjiensis TaxID=390269 RepID=A0A2P8GYA6_9MICO|nr:MraY family glycosyltransferase [Labedella gwakjiensis]PSL38944.1 UDP-GlcNAc:undecaprenyl-phosphate GlcNAc-1-phosphate transferase [Labedella gwakjiensis]RUQ86594.1 undecaprenyl/decaprenyl-phosphate alpha-N-acetylglucosaminyl 1-phosphate transferase [Labedella gwakjiensis]